jgi:hypothetical protein
MSCDVWRGLRSWIALLNEWDFRRALGQITVLGRPLFLVNDPPLVRQVLVEEVERFPTSPTPVVAGAVDRPGASSR